VKGILSNAFIFALGAGLGSIVTWKVLKNKYEQLAQEEIESVKEVFSRLRNTVKEEPDQEVEPESVDTADKYDEVLESEGYTSYSDVKTEKKGDATVIDDGGPYVIAPEEFGENDEYEAISLVYFADGVLADDQYEPVDDVDSIVGQDSLTHFGEYEDDSVFVRNDELKADYEILLDTRRYSDLEYHTPSHSEEG
jgi:hypothetical protein